MTVAETVLVGTVSGLTAALIAGAVAYIKLARSAMSRKEHDTECDRRLKDVRDNVKEIKQDVKDLRKSQSDSHRDLSAQVREVLKLIRANGRASGG